MKYVTVSNSETEGLGIQGVIIFNLIKEHNPKLYKGLKAENKLKSLIEEWEEEFISHMRSLMQSGLNQSEAREIAWPEITARFGT